MKAFHREQATQRPAWCEQYADHTLTNVGVLIIRPFGRPLPVQEDAVSHYCYEIDSGRRLDRSLSMMSTLLGWSLAGRRLC